MTSPREAVVQIKAVVETAIYVDDLQAVETCYGTGRHLGHRGGNPAPSSSHCQALLTTGGPP
jgi:hypothetical protein